MLLTATTFIENIIETIGNFYEPSLLLYGAIGIFLTILTLRDKPYMLIGLFFTRKFKPAKNLHKYAICIPARNEEAVISNLISSIRKQDYPQELITIFVIADNCTDNTAAVARENKGICIKIFI